MFIDKCHPTGKKIALYIEFVERLEDGGGGIRRRDSRVKESKGGRRLKSRQLRGLGGLPSVLSNEADLDISVPLVYFSRALELSRHSG